MSAKNRAQPTGDLVAAPVVESLGTLPIRRQFLGAIEQHVPNVLVALRDEVLPWYFAALPDLPRTAISWPAVTALDDRRAAKLKKLKAVLRTWAKRHNIECAWILDAAYSTLIHHEVCLCCTEGPGPCQLDITPGRLRWCSWLLDGKFPDNTELRLALIQQDRARLALFGDPDCALPSMDEPGQPEPPVPPGYIDGCGATFVSFWEEWNPFFQPWDDFERQARDKFELDLRWYKERMTAVAAAMGGTRAPEKRAEDHFVWAALYRCKEGTTLDDIRKASPHLSRDSGRSAVFRGIKDVERLIGLPSMRCRRGRRRGGKTSRDNGSC